MTRSTQSRSAAHRRRRFRRRTSPGASPGTIAVDPQALAPRIAVTAYDGTTEGLVRHEAVRVHELDRLRGTRAVLWVEVAGLGDADVIRGIGEAFALHALALEDVVNAHQSVKVDDYGDHLFIVARVPAASESAVTEQVSIFLGADYIVTFSEREGTWPAVLQRRLSDPRSLLRQRGADFLAYSVLDALLDSYFPLLEHYGEQIDGLEDALVRDPTPRVMREVHQLRSSLRSLRRIIWPYRDTVNRLIHDPNAVVGADTRTFLRDCLDHAVQLVDLLEVYRETCADLRDVYLSTVNTRMNEIMTVLTVIATVFIPLSFIASLYGMNFNPRASPWNMPELNWAFGYPFALGLMGMVTLGLLGYLRVKGWLGRPVNHHDEEPPGDA